MLRLKTIRNRLVALIFTITAAAVGFVYLYVVPQLESSLTAEKLRRLERVGGELAPELARILRSDPAEQRIRAGVERAARLSEARVTVLGVRTGATQEFPAFVIADSTGEAGASTGRYLPARAALERKTIVSGIDTIGARRVGSAAIPLTDAGDASWVVVVSTPLADVDDSVTLIQRQILIAGAIALVLAGMAGWLASGAVSNRLRRLRGAAARVAAGDFDDPIPAESDDEVGQLAEAFNDMQAQLARLDSARKEFIANASHELRTPIFSLGGFFELLETENPDEEERAEWMREMRAQIERLKKLTTDLLDLSKLDAGALVLRSEQIELPVLAREVAAEFRGAARQHGSKIAVRGRGRVAAQADPDRTAQIMRILIDNALKHTDEGTTVTVTAIAEDGSAELIVADDGRGIDPRAVSRIFERFVADDASTGSGLGLAIGRELAERMGGTIELDSRRSFTAFTLSLPGAGQAEDSAETAG